MRGEGTDTSDLDLVVVYERIDAAFRVSFIYAGWTSLVDDLRSPRSRTELIATGTALYTVLADHFLLGQGRWSASGKSIPRRLASVAPVFAIRFDEAFELLFVSGRTQAVIGLCAEVLASNGGWLFDGYKAVAPSDWRLQGGAEQDCNQAHLCDE